MTSMTDIARVAAASAGLIVILSICGCTTTRPGPSAAVHAAQRPPLALIAPRPDADGQISRQHESPAPLTVEAMHRTPSEAEAAIQQALMEAYTNFHYEEVIAEARHTLVTDDVSLAVRARAALLAGASAYLLGDRTMALLWFEHARFLDPEARPDPLMFPDAVLTLFEETQNVE
jgi:hypothetical protein